MKKLFLPLLFSLFTTTLFAQIFDKDKLDLYFQTLENNNAFMGSVAISENGKIIYTKSVGFADVENKTKPTAETKYRIGSITKSFTSAMILKAMEENKLSLDDKIDRYFPSIKNAEKITISNLLNHRSGIRSFTDDDSYLTWETQKKTEAELLKIIQDGGSEFEPDSKMNYSNSNYVLLSFILEKVYKKPYSEILNEKIIKPVGLTNTYYGDKINLKNHESNSYKFVKSWEKQSETDMSIPRGAGAIVSTPSDLLQFAHALFSGKIISEKSLKLMKIMRDDYGYGIFPLPFDGRKGFGHTGGIDSFTSYYGYFPTENVAFAITSNGKNYSNNKVAIAMLSAVFRQPFELPNFTVFEVKPADLDAYPGVYSSNDLPLKITVTKDNTILKAQATGQSAFPLSASEKNIFKFEPAGIVLEFNPAEKKMILKQGGKIYHYTKD